MELGERELSIPRAPAGLTGLPVPAAARQASPLPGSPAPAALRPARTTSLAARGEPFVWILTAAQIASVAMIVALLGLILYQGFLTFWPRPLVVVRLKSSEHYLGEVSRHERVRVSAPDGSSRFERRELLRIGNYDLYNEDFKWVREEDVAASERPADAVAIERLEWGSFLGFVDAFQVDGNPVTEGRFAAWTRLQAELPAARQRHEEIRRLEKVDIGEVNHRLEESRLRLRRAELRHGPESSAYRAAQEEAAAEEALLKEGYEKLAAEVSARKAEDARHTVSLADVGGQTKTIKASEIVRAFQPNRLSTVEKVGVYLSRWWEFLSAEPREANTEGGVFPAIFGTVAMTLLMALLVAPFGVIAALFLREYARQGLIVSAVRIAVNNLAGVPSIVFGVFGLGFFCYLVGGSIDQIFHPERLPAPTYGTGGILWASLTLALMTLPVVIVATEEALAAVPKSMREGAYGCGASKWQMIQRIVLPRAMPGILTGLVLAMARGAGEVAPLMITGVVKLAPELPIDGHFPFIHLERSFMHLGFHIYDVGFQSRNAEAGKPMVFTATVLLICVIVLINISVIGVRARLKRNFAVGQF